MSVPEAKAAMRRSVCAKAAANRFHQPQGTGVSHVRRLQTEVAYWGQVPVRNAMFDDIAFGLTVPHLVR